MTEPRIVDVEHQGTERVIGCWVHGDVLIDPGPASCLDTLLARLGEGFEPRAVLLTHIHLDHAGATGLLVRRFPDLEVYVHARGAPHVVDPSRLLDSAERLYGGPEKMDELWGETAPVPEANVTILEGGEEILGGAFEVEYTPGHASHHVCYWSEDAGIAYVGDIAGVRIMPSDFIDPPTPPPDIDVDAWIRSMHIVSGWQPEGLALTHFGLVDEPFEHLEHMEERLNERAQLAKELEQDAFLKAIGDELLEATGGDGATAEAFDQAAIPEHLYLGLERYWRKREG